MTVEELYEFLKKAQEPKGYFFNADKAKVFQLLEGLLVNKERYGYMNCPCRLASNDREWDRDIICPCVYRVPDVAEYAVATAISMSRTSGTRTRSPTSLSRKEDRRKKPSESHDPLIEHSEALPGDKCPNT